MNSEVSVLFDGEVEAHEAGNVLAVLKREPELRQVWCQYQTIGAALRHEDGLGCDITARVMAALDEEPTILAPQPRRAATWQRPLVALAASAAGIAVVGWMAFVPQGGADLTRPAALAQGQAKPSAGVKAAGQREMQEYLLAHQLNAPSSRLQGGTQHIRLVSASGGSDRR